MGLGQEPGERRRGGCLLIPCQTGTRKLRSGSATGLLGGGSHSLRELPPSWRSWHLRAEFKRDAQDTKPASLRALEVQQVVKEHWPRTRRSYKGLLPQGLCPCCSCAGSAPPPHGGPWLTSLGHSDFKLTCHLLRPHFPDHFSV